MKAKLRPILFSLFILSTPLIHAVDTLPPQSSLVEFDSKKGEKYLHESMNSNSLKLLSHFTTQKSTTYCGVASLVTVLNSSGLPAPIDSEHSDISNPDKTYTYFNQDDFFNDKVKNILGPDLGNNKELPRGITLEQLANIANQGYKLQAKAWHADQFRSNKDFEEKVQEALSNGDFVIVNFLRTALHQKGGGHHSPIAAYDKKSHRFLILDVARYKYPAYWVKSKDLWNAVNTRDGDANALRGVLIMRGLAKPNRPTDAKELEEEIQE